jgi:hypothetical protein
MATAVVVIGLLLSSSSFCYFSAVHLMIFPLADISKITLGNLIYTMKKGTLRKA